MRCNALLFQLVQRVYDTTAKRRLLLQKLALTRPADVPDGPIARVLQLRAHPVFGPFMKAFLCGSLQASSWPHEAREAWRAPYVEDFGPRKIAALPRSTAQH